VESSWAGLRPLIYEQGKPPSEVSRRDEIFVSPSGMLTIAGGKLTGYRKMAETVTDLLVSKLKLEGRSPFAPCTTRTLPISGGDVGGSRQYTAFVRRMTEEGVQMGLLPEMAERLVRRYGSNVTAVYSRIRDKRGGELTFGLPVELYATLLYGIEEEMVVKPVDFFIRRTGAMFFDIAWVQRWKDSIIGCMAECLNYSEEQIREYTEELERELQAAYTPIEDAVSQKTGSR